MSAILDVRNISKIYTISHEKARYKTFRDDVVNFIKNPFSAVTQDKEKFYALKDITFSLDAGETLGLIGPNGGGKSTLLKILSRITPPTEGEVRLKGTVSSLLEVGTGFHPELTGRENIFLSGAILGMRRQEIRKKFDEIVDFSGVEKFLDTPVKHYSSGMYTRLAFSVAAFLEQEILLVDEVLAVGDAAFQKKCIAKMKQTTKEGKTIIFVSHNMGAVSNLCTKCIHLEKGEIEEYGPTAKIVSYYLSESSKGIIPQDNSQDPGFPIVFKQVSLLNAEGKATTSFATSEPFCIKILAKIKKAYANFIVNVTVAGAAGNPLYNTQITLEELKIQSYTGDVELLLDMKPNIFGTGTFSITLTCDYQGGSVGYPSLLSFSISNEENFKFPKYIMHDGYVVYPRCWKVKKVFKR